MDIEGTWLGIGPTGLERDRKQSSASLDLVPFSEVLKGHAGIDAGRAYSRFGGSEACAAMRLQVGFRLISDSTTAPER